MEEEDKSLKMEIDEETVRINRDPPPALFQAKVLTTKRVAFKQLSPSEVISIVEKVCFSFGEQIICCIQIKRSFISYTSSGRIIASLYFDFSSRRPIS